MFIDTHCHLNFKAFESNLDSVLERAEKAGIEKIVIASAKLDSSEKAVEIAQKYPNCFAAVGIHPHHAEEFRKLGPQIIQKKLNLLINNGAGGGGGRAPESTYPPLAESTDGEGNPRQDPRSCSLRIVAIGEIGMDYHHYKNSPASNDETKKIQKELFLLQLEIAYEKKLPVIIHCRWAQTDVLNIISDFIKNKPLNGVFHCFDGNKEYLKNVLNLGFYVGFDGNSTYPENTHLRELMSFTPLDRLLLETDAPFLTPIPYRGTQNEPAYLIEVAKTVSEIHKKPITEVEDLTCSNAINLFSI